MMYCCTYVCSELYLLVVMYVDSIYLFKVSYTCGDFRAEIIEYTNRPAYVFKLFDLFLKFFQ